MVLLADDTVTAGSSHSPSIIAVASVTVTVVVAAPARTSAVSYDTSCQSIRDGEPIYDLLGEALSRCQVRGGSASKILARMQR